MATPAHAMEATSAPPAPPADPTPPPKRRKGPHLRPAHDVALLKEVVAHLPESKPRNQKTQTWELIAANTNSCFSGPAVFDFRRARDRTNILLEKFRNDDMDSLRASGTDEEYDERTQLLQELTDLNANASMLKEADKEKKDTDERRGRLLQEASLESMGEWDDGSSVSSSRASSVGRKRRRSSSAQEGEDALIRHLLEERAVAGALAQKQLDLEQRRVNLLEAEMADRRAEMADRRAEHAAMMRLMMTLAD